MTQQPEALRLAEKMESYSLRSGYAWHCHKAAAELRKLHEENKRLEAALRQATKDMMWLDNWLGGKPMPECITRLRKAITTAKQALEGKP